MKTHNKKPRGIEIEKSWCFVFFCMLYVLVEITGIRMYNEINLAIWEDSIIIGCKIRIALMIFLGLFGSIESIRYEYLIIMQ